MHANGQNKTDEKKEKKIDKADVSEAYHDN
jgi:hypothetical protein